LKAAIREVRPICKATKATAGDPAKRLGRIRAQAERIWGNETDATEWLNSPHLELRGAALLSLVKTEAGGRAVEALLGALEDGFPA